LSRVAAEPCVGTQPRSSAGLCSLVSAARVCTTECWGTSRMWPGNQTLISLVYSRPGCWGTGPRGDGRAGERSVLGDVLAGCRTRSADGAAGPAGGARKDARTRTALLRVTELQISDRACGRACSDDPASGIRSVLIGHAPGRRLADCATRSARLFPSVPGRRRGHGRPRARCCGAGCGGRHRLSSDAAAHWPGPGVAAPSLGDGHFEFLSSGFQHPWHWPRVRRYVQVLPRLIAQRELSR